MIPIAEGFKDYPADHFEHVIGTAIGVDEGKKTVGVERGDGSSKDVAYDTIVCATGSTYNSPLWTFHDDVEESIAEFKRFHDKIPQAESILVAGGGPAGVETAGTPPLLSPPLAPAKNVYRLLLSRLGNER
jgi:NADH dehydrogenase FAD-containing subunit